MMALEKTFTERYPWFEDYLSGLSENVTETELTAIHKLFYSFAWRDAKRTFNQALQEASYAQLLSLYNQPVSTLDKIKNKLGFTPSFISNIINQAKILPSYVSLYQQFSSEVLMDELDDWRHRMSNSNSFRFSALNKTEETSHKSEVKISVERELLLHHLALLNQLKYETCDDDRIVDKKTENVNYYFLELYYQRLDDFADAYGIGRVANYAQDQHLARKQRQDEFKIDDSDHFALVEHGEHEHYIRKRKRYISRGRFIALFVAIGCGFISAHATIGFVLPLVLLFAYAGFMTNWFLYSNSIVTTVQNLFIRKHHLHHGIDGKLSWPRLRKALINLSFAFALGAGVAFFALTWSSTLESLSFFGKLCHLMHAPTWLVSGVPFAFTLFISTAMLVGLTSIMFNSAATLLKSDMNTIKTKFKEWFYPDVGMAKFSIAHLAKIAIVLLFLGIGFFVGSLAAVALCGVMQEKIALLLVTNVGFSSSAAFWTSNFIAWTMNGFLRFTFSIKANMTFWSMCGSKVKELLIYPKESWEAIKNYYNFVKRSKWSVLFELFKIKMGLIVLINGGSQGYLSFRGQGPVVIHRATALDDNASKTTAFVTGAGSSTSINTNSTLDEYQRIQKHAWEHWNTHVFRKENSISETTHQKLNRLLEIDPGNQSGSGSNGLERYGLGICGDFSMELINTTRDPSVMGTPNQTSGSPHVSHGDDKLFALVNHAASSKLPVRTGPT